MALVEMSASGPLSIGVGCRRACPADAIVALVARACTGLPLQGAALFSIDAKRDEPGLRQAAAALRVPLALLTADQLRAALPGVTIRSPRAEATVGVASVAEAAALAGAGPGARLLVSRIAENGATCAVAVSRAGQPS